MSLNEEEYYHQDTRDYLIDFKSTISTRNLPATIFQIRTKPFSSTMAISVYLRNEQYKYLIWMEHTTINCTTTFYTLCAYRCSHIPYFTLFIISSCIDPFTFTIKTNFINRSFMCFNIIILLVKSIKNRNFSTLSFWIHFKYFKRLDRASSKIRTIWRERNTIYWL